MKETLDKLRMHSFYGRLNIEEMNKEVPTFPELIETIMMYQEALEAMTDERNFWRREAIT